MRIYLNNNPAKFHPNPIWNDGALDLFEEVANVYKLSPVIIRSIPHANFSHSHIIAA